MCLLVLVLCSFAGVRPEAHVESVRGIASITGSGDHTKLLRPGNALEPGDVITAGEDGYVVLRMTRGDRFEVYPNSVMMLRRTPGALFDRLEYMLRRVRARIEGIRYGTPPVIAVRA